MKTPSLVGIGLCLASLAPTAAPAGVKVDIRLGPGPCAPPARSWCGPVGYRAPCPPAYCPPRGGWYSTWPVYCVAPERVVVVRETSYAPVPVVIAPEPSYARLGRNWALDLRNEVVAWPQFVAWLRENLVRAPSGAYADFRAGFLAAYGVNAEAAFNKAYAEAS